jgi:Flp pilus assembly protein CpaB
MSIPVDGTHGMIGSVVAGDRVDIYADINAVVTAIAQNVYVLGVNSGAGGGLGSTGSSSSLILRVTPAGAARLAYASDNAKLWVVLRPATRGGVIKTRQATVPPLVRGPVVPEGD